jgi:hypothetical protein
VNKKNGGFLPGLIVGYEVSKNNRNSNDIADLQNQMNGGAPNPNAPTGDFAGPGHGYPGPKNLTAERNQLKWRIKGILKGNPIPSSTAPGQWGVPRTMRMVSVPEGKQEALRQLLKRIKDRPYNMGNIQACWHSYDKIMGPAPSAPAPTQYDEWSP